MSERGRAVLSFSLQAAIFTAVLFLAEYTASLIWSGSSARFLETVAEHWLEVVPVLVAMGALWALGMRAINRWEKRRAARREGGERKGKAE